MKIIFTKRFPFGRFRAISLFGRMYLKDKDEDIRYLMKDFPYYYKSLIEHERTHYEQQKEMWFVFFFIWYAVEWFIKLFFYRDAYRNLSFEREARANEMYTDKYYTKIKYDKSGHKIVSAEYMPYAECGSIVNRKKFAWLKYVFHK